MSGSVSCESILYMGQLRLDGETVHACTHNTTPEGGRGKTRRQTNEMSSDLCIIWNYSLQNDNIDIII